MEVGRSTVLPNVAEQAEEREAVGTAKGHEEVKRYNIHVSML